MSNDGGEIYDADLISWFQIILIVMLAIAVLLASLGYYADVTNKLSYLPVPVNDAAR